MAALNVHPVASTSNVFLTRMRLTGLLRRGELFRSRSGGELRQPHVLKELRLLLLALLFEIDRMASTARRHFNFREIYQWQ